MKKTFEDRANEISLMYEISFTHAGCYICNFEDDYMCHKFNGGCKNIELCRKIKEGDKK
jgi:hypothetical protein